MSEQKDPNEQYQVGDTVIYLPEGIYTEISGYVFYESMSAPPKVVKYKLKCGLDVTPDLIRRAIRDDA